MSNLITDNRFANPDQIYNTIIDAHRDLTDAQSRQMNARLVLILANHIGIESVLTEALELASEDL